MALQHLAAHNADKTFCGRSFARFLNVNDEDHDKFVRTHREPCVKCQVAWRSSKVIVAGMARLH
jgi:hypothetical protein